MSTNQVIIQNRFVLYCRREFVDFKVQCIINKMRYCSVKFCGSCDLTPNIVFFNVKDSWQILNCWKGETGFQVCSLHFESTAFTKCKRRLRPNAKPSIFWSPTAGETQNLRAMHDHNYSLPSAKDLKNRLDLCVLKKRSCQRKVHPLKEKQRRLEKKVI